MLNAMKYFIANTRYCHTLKLFKLLNFLDFEHYRQTGHSVTGLSYKAWEQGPVPSELWGELRYGPKDDLAREIDVRQVTDDLTDALLRRELRPKGGADLSLFTKREKKIMERLVELFRDVQANDMSKISHAKRLPWGKVFQGGKGSGEMIPYDLASSSESFMADMHGLSAAEIQARKELFAESNGSS